MLSTQQLAQFCALGDKQRNRLESAANHLRLSGRGLHRTLRVARTIADLEQARKVSTCHLNEALAYRDSGSQL
jgi:magnesium chelatase family protein